jgi:hypothetical protein
MLVLSQDGFTKNVINPSDSGGAHPLSHRHAGIQSASAGCVGGNGVNGCAGGGG